VFPDDTLVSPSSITKDDGSYYRVFTPFWKRARELLLAGGPQGRLLEAPQPASDPVDYDTNAVTQLGLLDTIAWHEKLHDHWQPGELAASQRMEQFFATIVADYSSSRDIPGVDGTSQLSAALHFGEISAMRVFSRSQEELLLQASRDTNDSLLRFQAELGWREFSRYVLMANPTSTDRSLDERFESDAAWEKGTDYLERWQQAQTGVPLVDAGMRQLWETGWMHNRVRMICASFLTKNLGVHWLQGARWFWDTLVDADLASNTLGWQWVAGCGTDAAPYYRIFNPEVQQKKFDPDGEYVSHWLRDHDNALPIVDLKISRARALERYEAIRNSG
jgi:deoxyribodipyrimidine photo-lyase